MDMDLSANRDGTSSMIGQFEIFCQKAADTYKQHVQELETQKSDLITKYEECNREIDRLSSKITCLEEENVSLKRLNETLISKHAKLLQKNGVSTNGAQNNILRERDQLREFPEIKQAHLKVLGGNHVCAKNDGSQRMEQLRNAPLKDQLASQTKQGQLDEENDGLSENTECLEKKLKLRKNNLRKKRYKEEKSPPELKRKTTFTEQPSAAIKKSRLEADLYVPETMDLDMEIPTRLVKSEKKSAIIIPETVPMDILDEVDSMEYTPFSQSNSQMNLKCLKKQTQVNDVDSRTCRSFKPPPIAPSLSSTPIEVKSQNAVKPTSSLHMTEFSAIAHDSDNESESDEMSTRILDNAPASPPSSPVFGSNNNTSSEHALPNITHSPLFKDEHDPDIIEKTASFNIEKPEISGNDINTRKDKPPLPPNIESLFEPPEEESDSQSPLLLKRNQNKNSVRVGVKNNTETSKSSPSVLSGKSKPLTNATYEEDQEPHDWLRKTRSNTKHSQSSSQGSKHSQEQLSGHVKPKGKSKRKVKKDDKNLLQTTMTQLFDSVEKKKKSKRNQNKSDVLETKFHSSQSENKNKSKESRNNDSPSKKETSADKLKFDRELRAAMRNSLKETTNITDNVTDNPTLENTRDETNLPHTDIRNDQLDTYDSDETCITQHNKSRKLKKIEKEKLVNRDNSEHGFNFKKPCTPKKCIQSENLSPRRSPRLLKHHHDQENDEGSLPDIDINKKLKGKVKRKILKSKKKLEPSLNIEPSNPGHIDLNGTIDPNLRLTQFEDSNKDGAVATIVAMETYNSDMSSEFLDQPGNIGTPVIGPPVELEGSEMEKSQAISSSCASVTFGRVSTHFENHEEDQDESSQDIFGENKGEDRNDATCPMESFHDSFDQLPKQADGKPDYAHVEVVRKHAERRKLKGFCCKECAKYLDTLALTDSQKKERLKAQSRHRGQFEAPSTPEHFWSIGMQDTPEVLENEYGGYMAVETKSQVKERPRRRRPFNKMFTTEREDNQLNDDDEQSENESPLEDL
ncbi:unnamed protein product [Owenia fusiformis]|uniref:DNA endonuclease activator Ctp1 C-terminal domain-containing protein n=1 Tax=Owenia fusiformis TaxID=6347 RepID=A0A8J1UUF6_OWEFU|nr:unnamed protein product [Owenia fusiformis]